MRDSLKLVTLVAVSATLACEQPDPLTPGMPAQARIDGTVELPFRAQSSGVLAPLFVSPRCPNLTAAYTTYGVGTHLGRFQAAHTHCADPAAPAISTDGEVRLQAANGDSLFLAYAGQLLPTGTLGIFDVKNPFEIVGGTGRFENATGGGETSGLVDIGARSVRLQLDGIIRLARQP